MAEIRIRRVAVAGLVLAALAACTAQDRYHSMRRQNLEDCERKLSEVERQRCREQVVPASYEEYERLRSTVPNGRPKPAVQDPDA